MSKRGLIAVVILAGCGHKVADVPTASATLTVHCDAFQEGKPIAAKNSGYFDNVSPEISWTGVPAGTKSIAVLVDDSDAPGPSPFTHWMIANISAVMEGLPEGIPKIGMPPTLPGSVQGVNDMGGVGYFGPKPEAGPSLHHYRFEVLALDAKVKLKPGFSRSDFTAALKGHLLATGTTTGTYARRSVKPSS